MKSRFLKIAAVALVMYGLSFGQWSRTDPNVFLSNSGDNVGIGVGNPFNKLDIAGNVGLRDNDLLLRGQWYKDGNHGLGYYGPGKLWNGIPVDGPVLYGYTGGILGINRAGTQSSILYWNSTGIGIGTGVSPTERLTVAGGESQFSNGTTYSDPQFGVPYDAKFGGSGNGIAVKGQSYFAGNIGIGTTTTGSCKLAVAGKIAAREVIVTQAASWPDYVFKNDYKLTSLAEVEKQIKRDGHLDGIPSAADVEKNGVPVGEMQAKVLQKVEELTLHMIEMQKENDELKLKVSKLELAARAR